MSTLTVELNSGGVHTIRAPDRFVTDESFSVKLVNKGQPVHTYLNLDENLSRVASVETTNNYVKGDRTVHVQISVTNPVTDPVRGKLKVVTGHGAWTKYVTIVIEPVSEEEEWVIVDESLGQPPQRDPNPSLGSKVIATARREVERGIIPAVLLVAFAILLAIGVALTVDSVAVLLGAAVVIIASLGSAYFLLQ